MNCRQMATVRKIDAIDPIENADAIEVATVGGWKVVVKKGDFQVNELAVYCEIDSWIPTEVAPFLSKGDPREYDGITGERLRTIRLRGQVSQGLLLKSFGGVEGDDVSEALCIRKWEAPINAQLAGMAKGNFPSAVPKTDQERVQNLKKELSKWSELDLSWEITEKLEGSSMTCYMSPEGEFEVCSRNLSLKREGGSTFWKVAIEQNIEQKMRDRKMFGAAIQGELVGEGIQGNIYGLKGHHFYVFDIYSVEEAEYLPAYERTTLLDVLDFNHAPIIKSVTKISYDMSTLIENADGASCLKKDQVREGLVYKCLEMPELSFKTISNKYLLKQK